MGEKNSSTCEPKISPDPDVADNPVRLWWLLDALRGIGILHADLKPDNIMFVDMQDQPSRIKVIDFGEAVSASSVQPGDEVQPLGYRAPEIVLGLPFTEAIDVWGVGCILALLFLDDHIFPSDSEYQMMHSMLEVLGQVKVHSDWIYFWDHG